MESKRSAIKSADIRQKCEQKERQTELMFEFYETKKVQKVGIKTVRKRVENYKLPKNIPLRVQFKTSSSVILFSSEHTQFYQR